MDNWRDNTGRGSAWVSACTSAKRITGVEVEVTLTERKLNEHEL